MNKWLCILGCAGLMLVMSTPAIAQTPYQEVDPFEDFREPGDAGTSVVPDPVAPAVPSVVSVDVDTLYREITTSGRCPEGMTAPRRVPCALLEYPDGKRRPIFKVETEEIVWTLIDGEFARVNIEQLASARAHEDSNQVSRIARVVGFSENARRCASSHSTCLDGDVFRQFGRGKVLSFGCVNMLWKGDQASMDVVYETQCRFATL